MGLLDAALLGKGPFPFMFLLLANLEVAVLPPGGLPPSALLVPAAPPSARCRKWCNCRACGALPRMSVSCSRDSVTRSARLSTRFKMAKMFFEFTPGILSSIFCGTTEMSIEPTLNILFYLLFDAHGWLLEIFRRTT